MALRTQWAVAALALVLSCHQCAVHSEIALKDPATDPELVKIAQLTAMLATPAPADSVAQDCTPAVLRSSSWVPQNQVVVRCDPRLSQSDIGANFPGSGVAVSQRGPLADQGNRPAPVGGSHFQPLPTNLAGVGLGSGGGSTSGGGGGSSGPQLLTGEAALASLGQAGHKASGADAGQAAATGQGQGAWRGTGAKGAAASTQPSYAAKIGQASLPVGAAATAGAQQGVSLLARQPGLNPGGSNPGGSNPVVVNGGSSLVATATDNILGASTAGTGSSTGPTTAGGSGLLMPGRRLLRGSPSPVK